MGIKGYKLYDIHINQFFFSRDVIFHEDVFPFHSITPQEDLLDPFPNLVLPIPENDVPLFHLKLITLPQQTVNILLHLILQLLIAHKDQIYVNKLNY